VPLPLPFLAAAAASREALAKLSDIELLARLTCLVKQERGLTVAVLVHLSEVERRELHLAKGYSSLFAYCVQRLGLSEDVAYKRVGAARYGRRFPLALDLLSQGALHLSALMLVGPHLTDANHREWLTAVAGKSKRETELFVATRCPKPDVPSSVRKLPQRQARIQARANLEPERAVQSALIGDTAASLSNATRTATASELQPSHASESAFDRPRVQPLSGSTFRVVLTADEVLKQKLDRARELCSHSVAPGDLPALFGRALDLLIEREEKRRYAARSPKRCKANPEGESRTARRPASRIHQDPDPGSPVEPEKQPTEPIASVKEFSRHVPAVVRRAVWERDGGQCAFVDDEGNRCNARDFLDIDHVDAYARGGPTAICNCRLLCRAHNQHRAKLTFGTDFMICARSRKATK
jgi:hypothetical protein